MINWGLRAGQLMAERSDVRRMSHAERTRLWYRLERIGEGSKDTDSLSERLDALEERQPIVTYQTIPTRELDDLRRKLSKVNTLLDDHLEKSTPKRRDYTYK